MVNTGGYISLVGKEEGKRWTWHGQGDVDEKSYQLSTLRIQNGRYFEDWYVCIFRKYIIIITSCESMKPLPSRSISWNIRSNRIWTKRTNPLNVSPSLPSVSHDLNDAMSSFSSSTFSSFKHDDSSLIKIEEQGNYYDIFQLRKLT